MFIGKVLLDDGLGTVANVIREVKTHPYGKQSRWEIDIMEPGNPGLYTSSGFGNRHPARVPARFKRNATQAKYSQVNDSQILKWL